MKHIKALDGIRFLAVTLVLMEHWLDTEIKFAVGYSGVCVFFVLSGFLITSILLKAKVADNEANRNHGRSLKLFYIRRTIRIFPVYYLLILIAFLLNEPSVHTYFWWIFTYTSNIYIASHQTWMGVVDHFWSLAVEEQFYLFFPCVVFFVPLKYLPKTLIFLSIIAVLLRLYFYMTGYLWMTSYVLMPTCLDAFSLGGLMAYFFKFKNKTFVTFFKNRIGLVISLLVYVLSQIYIFQFNHNHGFLSVVLMRCFESILAVYLIGNAIIGLPIYSKILLHPVSLYLGKISYGIYIFHNFIYNHYHASASHPMTIFFKNYPFFDEHIYIKFFFLYGITIAFASISWFLIEKPINKLKDKFEY